MLRAAGSMKLGWVTASLFVQKLQAHPQQNVLPAPSRSIGALPERFIFCGGRRTLKSGAASCAN